MKKLMILLLLSMAVSVAAKERAWQQGKLTKITSDAGGTAALIVPMGTGLMGLGVPMVRLYYWVETDSMIYVLLNPRADWTCCAKKYSDFTVNRKIKIAVEGASAHLLNDSAKDVKFRIVQKVAKDQP